MQCEKVESRLSETELLERRKSGRWEHSRALLWLHLRVRSPRELIKNEITGTRAAT